MNPDILAARIKTHIEATRIDVSTEQASHRMIEQLLNQNGIETKREVRLGKSDRIDLMVGGVAIEVKSARRTGRIGILKQLTRYTLHAEVEALVVATSGALPLPGTINSKPVLVASLNLGWLG